MPRDKTTNVPNEPCLQDLRAALCTTRIDFAALTDHDGSMADEEFTTLFSMRGSDSSRPQRGETSRSGRGSLCADGHRCWVSVGGETI